VLHRSNEITLSEDDQIPIAKSKSRGRQRSEESEEAILKATLLLLKEKPLRDVTIDEIARRAGVGKATIYKWWPSKACVALDAFTRNFNRSVPIPDTGSAETDFKEQLHSLYAFYASGAGHIFRQFLAEAQSDKEFARLFRERFLKPRREAIGVIFDRAVKRGEIEKNLDRELVMDMIYGPGIFRLLVEHAPLNRKAADSIISTLYRGLRVSSAKTKKR
jgi:AcrR family transcriptional regulator